MSESFEARLGAVVEDVVDRFGTPFHIYDETGIRETGAALKQAFGRIPGFREYFAVKALPNPRILRIMHQMGFGLDCSSATELTLSRGIGAHGDDLMFTSNDTSAADFEAAERDGGCILNLDDISLIDKVPRMPEAICFRYNPGSRRSGNSIIGKPEEAKYGVAHEQLVSAYQRAKAAGARRFGLHTMLVSNERDHQYMVQTAKMLLDLVEWIAAEVGIVFEFVNIGGGLGIPYRPQDAPLDLDAMGQEITALFGSFKDHNRYVPKLYMESGRYMTGPHGALVVRAINRKDIYRTYVGVDACMSALMRPGMYDAYHHVTVVGNSGDHAVETVDVVGYLCENNDKFAIQRSLPKISDGDTLFIHDTGAHGHAMGFNYNGALRPQELLLRCDGSVELIRRAETPKDYFATLEFEPKVLELRRS